MADNFRKLKRADLLELMLEQGKEIERLKSRIEELEKQLEDRSLRLSKAGTIAEAAFQVNGVLGAAEAAAKDYLDSLAYIREQQEADIQRQKEELEQLVRTRTEETEKTCERRLRETEVYCAEQVRDIQEYCRELERKTRDSCSSS